MDAAVHCWIFCIFKTTVHQKTAIAVDWCWRKLADFVYCPFTEGVILVPIPTFHGLINRYSNKSSNFQVCRTITRPQTITKTNTGVTTFMFTIMFTLGLGTVDYHFKRIVFGEFFWLEFYCDRGFINIVSVKAWHICEHPSFLIWKHLLYCICILFGRLPYNYAVFLALWNYQGTLAQW